MIKRMLKVGTKVKIIRKKSVDHFQVLHMPIKGEIVVRNANHYDGLSYRPYKVRFDDDRESWWAQEELREVK